MVCEGGRCGHSTDVDTGSIHSGISNRSHLNNRLTTLDALLVLIT